MRNIITNAKKGWIDQTIKYRDEVVHFGQLRGFTCDLLPLSPKLKYDVSEVLPASMPDNTACSVFVEDLVNATHVYSREWLAVNFKRLRERPEYAAEIIEDAGV